MKVEPTFGPSCFSQTMDKVQEKDVMSASHTPSSKPYSAAKKFLMRRLRSSRMLQRIHC